MLAVVLDDREQGAQRVHGVLPLLGEMLGLGQQTQMEGRWILVRDSRISVSAFIIFGMPSRCPAYVRAQPSGTFSIADQEDRPCLTQSSTPCAPKFAAASGSPSQAAIIALT